jgi:hypothetical protein
VQSLLVWRAREAEDLSGDKSDPKDAWAAPPSPPPTRLHAVGTNLWGARTLSRALTWTFMLLSVPPAVGAAGSDSHPR